MEGARKMVCDIPYQLTGALKWTMTVFHTRYSGSVSSSSMRLTAKAKGLIDSGGQIVCIKKMPGMVMSPT